MPKVNKDDPWGAALPPGTKVETKPRRDYIGEAVASLSMPVGTSVAENATLISAIIIAQALDRFGAKLIDAAAISKPRGL